MGNFNAKFSIKPRNQMFISALILFKTSLSRDNKQKAEDKTRKNNIAELRTRQSKVFKGRICRYQNVSRTGTINQIVQRNFSLPYRSRTTSFNPYFFDNETKAYA